MDGLEVRRERHAMGDWGRWLWNWGPWEAWKGLSRVMSWLP